MEILNKIRRFFNPTFAEWLEELDLEFKEQKKKQDEIDKEVFGKLRDELIEELKNTK